MELTTQLKQTQWRQLWRHYLLLWHITITMLMLSAPAQASEITLPELGSSARASFSQQQEEILSLAFLEALYTQADLNEDPELNSYIRDIGAKLLRHTHSSRRFHFYIINDNSINAFAGPGGIIAVHTGLILAAKTEDELAAVIAHEIHHVQQEHLSRMFDHSKKGMIPMLAGIVGALLVGSQSPQAAMAMMTGSIAYNAQQQLAFSRDHEWEADRFGIDTLHAAGYNPEAMADFFETLASRYRNDAKAPEILMSHPVTDKRISDSRARARNLLTRSQARNGLTLKLAQERIYALNQQPIPQESVSSCYYQRVMQWSKQTPIEPCQTLPKHWFSDLIRLQTSPEKQQEQQWIRLLDIYPNNSAILLRRADYLFDSKRYQEVIELLDNKISLFNETWQMWQKVARSWHELNDNATASWALSKAYSSIGYLKLARIQLDKAEREAQSSHNTHLTQLIEKQANWLTSQELARKSLE